MRPLIIDTHLAIWLVRDVPIASAAAAALSEAGSRKMPVFVSPISAWEVGLLVSRGRLNLDVTPLEWFERLLGTPGIQVAPMPAGLLIAASFLPGKPPRDPGDRIIAATARDLEATLLTRDRLLLDYAAHGHIRAIAC